MLFKATLVVNLLLGLSFGRLSIEHAVHTIAPS